jgi:glycosyltransferase involved in cell wall biosynthesis
MPNGNILIIAPSAYPLGGVATWIDYIVPGLRQRGWRVTLGLTEGILHNVNEYLATHPMQGVIRIRNRTGTREGRVRSLCAAIAAVQPDIVASVNVADVYSAVTHLKRNRSRVRAVMTLHEIGVDYYEQIKSVAGSLDAVIATNRLACKLASSIGGLESCRIYYAPCGVDIPGSFGAGPKRPLTPIRIGFVGRLDKPKKRVDALVTIIREMDRENISYQLLIAGAGPEESWLRDELKLNVDRGTVQFLGALSSKEMEALYGVIDILLITSKSETGPIVAWEAMARRVLVVTSAYIGSRLEGNLRHGENCLIYPVGNATAAVECIVKGQDEDLRSRIANAGIALVHKEMNHERSIQYWSRCFADINNKTIRPASFLEDTGREEPAGRLDRLFGTRFGETLRHMLQRKAMLSVDPGDEWPHVSVTSKIPQETFWDIAKAADMEVTATCHVGQRPEHGL